MDLLCTNFLHTIYIHRKGHVEKPIHGLKFLTSNVFHAGISRSLWVGRLWGTQRTSFFMQRPLLEKEK